MWSVALVKTSIVREISEKPCTVSNLPLKITFVFEVFHEAGILLHFKPQKVIFAC